MYTDNPEQDYQDFLERQDDHDEPTQEEIDEIKENFALMMKNTKR